MSRLLFPDIVPVSQAEIEAWLDTVPNLSRTPWRRRAYAEAYRVEEKIRATKLQSLVKNRRGKSR